MSETDSQKALDVLYPNLEILDPPERRLRGEDGVMDVYAIASGGEAMDKMHEAGFPFPDTRLHSFVGIVSQENRGGEKGQVQIQGWVDESLVHEEMVKSTWITGWLRVVRAQKRAGKSVVAALAEHTNA